MAWRYHGLAITTAWPPAWAIPQQPGGSLLWVSAACPGCVTSLAISLLHQPGCSKLLQAPQRSLGWEHLPVLGSFHGGMGVPSCQQLQLSTEALVTQPVLGITQSVPAIQQTRLHPGAQPFVSVVFSQGLLPWRALELRSSHHQSLAPGAALGALTMPGTHPSSCQG